MTFDDFNAELVKQGASVDMPAELRAEHQPDPQRLEQGTQCVCTCGALCLSYVGHLAEVVEHAEYWEQARAAGHDPLVAFAKAGINPFR